MDTLLGHRDVDNLLSGAPLHPFHVNLFKSLGDRDIDDLIVVALKTLSVLRHGFVHHKLLHDMLVTAFLTHTQMLTMSLQQSAPELSKNLKHKHSDDETDVSHIPMTTQKRREKIYF